MKNNPDDRSDNMEKIQRNIDDTRKNMELADDMINLSDNDQAKKELKDKNNRRRAALDAMRNEIKDEADFKSKK